MPERFAQAALGHNSKAIHRAYAKKAVIIAPSLEDYERKAATLQPMVMALNKTAVEFLPTQPLFTFGDLRHPQTPRQRRDLWTRHPLALAGTLRALFARRKGNGC